MTETRHCVLTTTEQKFIETRRAPFDSVRIWTREEGKKHAVAYHPDLPFSVAVPMGFGSRVLVT